MKVIGINTEWDGFIGLATNYENAIKYLIKENWLDENFLMWDYDREEYVTVEKFLEDEEDWKKCVLNWGIETFNDLFEGNFFLEEVEVYAGD